MSRTLLAGASTRWAAFMLAAVLAASSQAACHWLTNEHADLRVVYTPGPSNQLGLMVFDHEHSAAWRTNEVTLVGGNAARLTLPPGTPFGEGGNPIWILPQNQNSQLPYLGTSGVGVPSAALASETMHIRLIRVDGPGHFLLWQTLGPGQYDIQMDSRDGITAADASLIGVDAHKHYSWGFTTAGVYRLTFQVAGTLAGQTQPSVGAEHTFLFHILPLRPWENWQATHWPCECRPSLIGMDADPDGDGLSNLAEYAQGTHPNQPDAAQRPRAAVVQFNGESYGALVFQRAKAATDVLRLPVAAATLTGGVWEPLSQTHLVEDLGEVERVTLRDTQPLHAVPWRWYQLQLQEIR